MTSKKNLVVYQPFSSIVEPIFWSTLTKTKLNEWKLDNSEKTIFGTYRAKYEPDFPTQFWLNMNSFEYADYSQKEYKHLAPFSFMAPGTILNTNTMKEYKNLDKIQLFKNTANLIWQDIVNGEALEDTSRLGRFLLLTYADLKKYIFYYWFAFPALILKGKNGDLISHKEPPVMIDKFFSEKQIEALYGSLLRLREPDLESDEDKISTGKTGNLNVFLIKKTKEKEEDAISVGKLSEWNTFWGKEKEENKKEESEDIEYIVGFIDPSGVSFVPGWPLRNILALISVRFAVSRLKVVCIREDPSNSDIKSSFVLDLQVPVVEDVSGKNLKEGQECVFESSGWEKNTKGKLAPRVVDLSGLMSPEKLAESAVNLNLQLMRWRLLPELDLEIISRTKCLLIGAGTLGCVVGRALLGWGFRHITFVDGGRVSYSNPVRQWLYTFEDSHVSNGRYKATVAGEQLSRIFPSVKSSGHVIMIPMPGHVVTSREIEATKKSVEEIENLIKDHDVVFLMTDTRESRWLPSMLCAYHGKPVIDIALGFANYFVMRHGVPEGESDGGVHPKSPMTHACYFCQDVVAPIDSISDRTLDMQCTVTRPALSPIAGSLGVELLVSILHHPQKWFALSDTKESPQEVKSPLGYVPHQIRGYLSSFDNFLVSSSPFSKCVACSSIVRNAYHEGGFDFLLKVFNEPSFLENLTGLDLLHKNVEKMLENYVNEMTIHEENLKEKDQSKNNENIDSKKDDDDDDDFILL
eukprot:Anaeramoba_ignava/a1306_275.p1 GENE.a1306_275~~a1306_275.p1  ORF type:complete len:749 (+),score=141.98 a1306_275:32-2278(+)